MPELFSVVIQMLNLAKKGWRVDYQGEHTDSCALDLDVALVARPLQSNDISQGKCVCSQSVLLL